MIIENEEILRRKCVDANKNEVKHIISLLDRELRASSDAGRPGIGLAAPQIGISKNIAIIRLGEHKVDLVNSKIEQGFDYKLFNGEGCLSFPNLSESTLRYDQIVVSNNIVYPHRFTATGLLAVVIQHEIDHLNNILLPDISVKDKLNKLKANDLCICGSKKKFKKCCWSK